MKGFIKVTENVMYGNTLLVHYSKVHFILQNDGYKIPIVNGKQVKETYEEIVKLIQLSQQ